MTSMIGVTLRARFFSMPQSDEYAKYTGILPNDVDEIVKELNMAIRSKNINVVNEVQPAND